MEKIALWVSTFFYLFSFCSTLLALRAKQLRPGRFSFIAIFLGVVSQSWFLILRGKDLHACPTTTLPGMLIFLSWVIGWFYLLIGSTYRVSLMGVFTAPLILILQSIGCLLLVPIVSIRHTLNPWIEAHAALSLVAFGALGLASVSALMFLFQEAQLKSQAPAPIFHFLPPMQLLEITTARLLWLGLGLLTISFIAGAFSGISISRISPTSQIQDSDLSQYTYSQNNLSNRLMEHTPHDFKNHFETKSLRNIIYSNPRSRVKFWLSLLLWGSYGLLGIAQQGRHLSAHRFAQGMTFIFLFALGILFWLS